VGHIIQLIEISSEVIEVWHITQKWVSSPIQWLNKKPGLAVILLIDNNNFKYNRKV
jgi:hypothetical protein